LSRYWRTSLSISLLALVGVAIQLPSLSPTAILALMLLLFACTQLRHRMACATPAG